MLHAIVAVQGLVSHPNLDIRVGALNRVLMGTELHRWHHAVGLRGDYAGVLSLWDGLGGSLVYRPGEQPARLGVEPSPQGPSDTQLLDLLAEPLGLTRRGAAPH